MVSVYYDIALHHSGPHGPLQRDSLPSASCLVGTLLPVLRNAASVSVVPGSGRETDALCQ